MHEEKIPVTFGGARKSKKRKILVTFSEQGNVSFLSYIKTRCTREGGKFSSDFQWSEEK